MEIKIFEGKSKWAILLLLFIFIILTKNNSEPKKAQIPALEAYPEAEKTVYTEYPDAELVKIAAGMAWESRPIASGSQWYEVRLVKTEFLLHDDGAADVWSYVFYSPSEMSDISVKAWKHKGGQFSSEIYDITKVRPWENRENATFQINDCKINSIDAVSIAKSDIGDDFSFIRVELKCVDEPAWYFYSSSEGLEWNTVTISAVSGEIIYKRNEER